MQPWRVHVRSWSPGCHTGKVSPVKYHQAMVYLAKSDEILQLLQTALDTPPPNLHFRFCWLNLACINLNLARDCFAWCYKSIKTTHESSFSACETLEHRPMELPPAFLHLHFCPIALLGSFKVRDSSKLNLIFILSLSDHI